MDDPALETIDIASIRHETFEAFKFPIRSRLQRRERSVFIFSFHSGLSHRLSVLPAKLSRAFSSLDWPCLPEVADASVVPMPSG